MSLRNICNNTLAINTLILLGICSLVIFFTYRANIFYNTHNYTNKNTPQETHGTEEKSDKNPVEQVEQDKIDPLTHADNQRIRFEGSCLDTTTNTTYGAREYYEQWKTVFMDLNSISHKTFSKHINDIHVQAVQKHTCIVSVHYIITVDWVTTKEQDELPMGNQNISPAHIKRQNDAGVFGRSWVSLVNLDKPLAITREEDIVRIYKKNHNLDDSDMLINFTAIGVKDYWEWQQDAKHGFASDVVAGDIFAKIEGASINKKGIVDIFREETEGNNDNASIRNCFEGEISLMTKKSSYREIPCIQNIY